MRNERDEEQTSDGDLFCSARRKKAEAQCEELVFACTSAGNEHQALKVAGYPASWVIVTCGRRPRRSNEPNPPVSKRMATRDFLNASDVRRPGKRFAQGALRQTQHELTL